MAPPLLLVFLALLRAEATFNLDAIWEQFEANSPQKEALPAATDLRINYLSPSRYAEEGKTGLVLALDAPQPLFSWHIPPPSRARRGVRVNGAKVVVVSDMPGTKTRTVWAGNLTKSEDLFIRYGGPPLEIGTRYCFKVWWQSSSGEWSPPSDDACYEFGLGSGKDGWHPSLWLGDDGMNVVRSSFAVSKEVLSKAKRARVYISAGFAQIHLNGEHISQKEILGVGMTRYDKRVYYVAYEVLPLLKSGENVIGLELGQGWRDQYQFKPLWVDGEEGYMSSEREGRRAAFTVRAFRAVIKVLMDDGHWHTLSYTNPKEWLGTKGPVVNDTVFDGETYDSRINDSLAGWRLPNYDDDEEETGKSRWKIVPDISYQNWSKTAKLQAQPIYPMRVQEIRKPVEVTVVGKNHLIIDFGANLVGVCRFLVPKGARGSNFTVRHAEVKVHEPFGVYGSDDDSYLYYWTLRDAKQTDTYIFSGRKEELGTVWKPKFTYHGFRYIEITNWPCNNGGEEDDQWPDHLTCKQMPQVELLHHRTDFPQIGEFRTSNGLLNAFHRMAAGGLSSNMNSITTDCPQRDERVGWLGDAGISADMASMTYDTNAFHNAYLDLIVDDLDEHGNIPDVVPHLRYGQNPGDPSWSSALVTIMYSRYHFANDLSSYRKHRDDVKLYLEGLWRFVMEEQGGLYRMLAVGVQFGYIGEWVANVDADRPTITYTSVFAWLLALQKSVEMATAAGDEEYAAIFSRNATEVAELFTDVYFNNITKWFENQQQTSMALGLRLNVLSPEDATLASQNLYNRITQADGGNWTTGQIGFKFLLQQLAKYGYGNVSADLVTATQFPSLGYERLNTYEPGITSLWERWDAFKIQTKGMDSRNHQWSSTVGTFIYEMCGLVSNQEKGLGFSFEKPLQLRAQGCCGLLKHACAKTNNANGPLSFCWSIEEVNRTDVRARIPTGTLSVIEVPLRLLQQDADGNNGDSNGMLPLQLRMKEKGEVFFEGMIFKGNTTLEHKDIPGLHALAFDHKAAAIKLTVASGVFHFQLDEAQ